MDINLQHILDRDRRNCFRVAPDPEHPVRFEPAGAEPVPVIDISAGGLCLDVAALFLDGKPAAAGRLHLPGLPPMEVVVQLVSRTAERQHLMFSGLNDAAREDIYRYVLRREIELVRNRRPGGGAPPRRPEPCRDGDADESGAGR